MGVVFMLALFSQEDKVITPSAEGKCTEHYHPALRAVHTSHGKGQSPESTLLALCYVQLRGSWDLGGTNTHVLPFWEAAGAVPRGQRCAELSALCGYHTGLTEPAELQAPAHSLLQCELLKY